MTQTLLTRPVYLHELSPRWQAFIRRAYELGFGELHDCQVEDHQIVTVERVIKNHTGRSWFSASLLDPSKPLPENWVYLLKLCASRSESFLIRMIKLDAGQPVSFQTDEGEWNLKENA